MSLVKNSNEDLKCLFSSFVAVCNNENDLRKSGRVGRIMILFIMVRKRIHHDNF